MRIRGKKKCGASRRERGAKVRRKCYAKIKEIEGTGKETANWIHEEVKGWPFGTSVCLSARMTDLHWNRTASLSLCRWGRRVFWKSCRNRLAEVVGYRVFVDTDFRFLVRCCRPIEPGGCAACLDRFVHRTRVNEPIKLNKSRHRLTANRGTFNWENNRPMICTIVEKNLVRPRLIRTGLCKVSLRNAD